MASSVLDVLAERPNTVAFNSKRWNVEDEQIPGLIEYIESEGVVDSPVNRKTYRFAYAFMLRFNMEAPPGSEHNSGGPMSIEVLWSKTISRSVAFVGILHEPGVFVPVLQVVQSELIGGAAWGALDLDCSKECSDNDGVCLIDFDHSSQATPPVNEDAERFERKVADDFAHIVESWGETPDADKLAGLYEVPKEGGKEDGTRSP